VGGVRPNTTTIAADVLLAAVLTGLTVVTVVSRPDADSGPLLVLLAVLTVAPIALRQVAPVTTLTVVLVALLALSLVSRQTFPDGGLGLVTALFSVATLCSRTVTAWLFGASLVVVVGSIVIVGDADATIPMPVFWSELAKAVLIAIGAWVLGLSTKRWAERTEHLAARAERAAAQERVRIARELHDVVSHHMSVISLQAGVSRYLLDTDPAAARTALATVEDESREALSEMRRLLEVLRPEQPADVELRPQPGLADLESLVERTRAAGVPVEVAVSGRLRTLPSGPDLCAYRVVQESLTNVIKHAGPATVRIGLDYGEDTLTLRVADDGAGPVSPPRAGQGIRGMRERAELYGGTLEAGPRDEGGFAVEARIPVGDVR